MFSFEATKAAYVGKEYSIGAINQYICGFNLAMAVALIMDESKAIGKTVEPVQNESAFLLFR